MMPKFVASQHKKALLVATWKREKSSALGEICLKPLFCMAAHNCELKITQEAERERDPRHSENQLKSLYSARLLTAKFLIHSYDTNRNAGDFSRFLLCSNSSL